MNIFYKLYLDIIFKGNDLIKDKKYIPDYFKFMMGIIVGFSISLFIFTDYTVAAFTMIIAAYLLFYFVKENLESTPTMVFKIESDQTVEEIMQELNKQLKDK